MSVPYRCAVQTVLLDAATPLSTESRPGDPEIFGASLAGLSSPQCHWPLVRTVFRTGRSVLARRRSDSGCGRCCVVGVARVVSTPVTLHETEEFGRCENNEELTDCDARNGG